MPDIRHHLAIGASPETVWSALTSAGSLARWWTIGYTQIEGDPGRLGSFRFFSRVVVIDLQVTFLEAPRRLAWRGLGSRNAPADWKGTEVNFGLSPTVTGVDLDFRHQGFAQEGPGLVRITEGWAQFLQALKAMTEAPSRNPPAHSPREGQRLT